MTKQRYDRFSDWLEQGRSKEEIMMRFGLNEQQYEKAKADVERIRKGRRA